MVKYMTKHARIVNGTIVDCCNDPFAKFHPELAKEFVEIPDGIENGYYLKDGNWVKPEPQPVFEIEKLLTSTKIEPFAFKLLFTAQERIDITAAKAVDPIINDFFTLLDDPRFLVVDISLESTKQIIEHLVSIGILTSQRAADILIAKPI